jgi:membrane-bound lytic murein transglycosylase B
MSTAASAEHGSLRRLWWFAAALFVPSIVAGLVFAMSVDPGHRAGVYAASLPEGSTSAPSADAPRLVLTANTEPTLDEISTSWVDRTANLTGIPAIAVRAYAAAQLAAPAGCHLGWTTLAGIGWIESGHGSHGGSALLANGETTRAISGPQLAGGLGAALGPMQFIADTWDRWATDGDGDGSADVNNINDAAYTAARYLCADGRDLANATQWAAAVYSYNHAQWYVDEVYDAANTYAKRAG